jgi:hypothetical protein
LANIDNSVEEVSLVDFLTIVFAFAIGAIVFGLMLLLASLVERTAPEEAVRSVSGSARENI